MGYWHSAKEYIRRIAAHWLGLVVSGIGGLLGFAQLVFSNWQHTVTARVGAQERAVREPVVEWHFPMIVWLALMVAGLAAAMFLAFHDIRVERDSGPASGSGTLETVALAALKDRRTTTLKLTAEGQTLDIERNATIPGGPTPLKVDPPQTGP